jgi:ADP-ribose pyrophosphatase YjhB (NUDIX family)
VLPDWRCIAGHLLIHRAAHEPFWTIPGGTAELGEDSRTNLGCGRSRKSSTLRSTVGRLVFLVENFFDLENRAWHELGWYYLMGLPE